MSQAEYNRLRWSCRRGMRELDFWFLDFLDHHYSALTSEEQETFAQLLEYPDQTLFEWLMNTAQPTVPRLRQMIGKMQNIVQQDILSC